MRILAINLIKLCIVWAIAVLIIASCANKTYPNHVHHKADELALVGYLSTGAQSSRTFFVRNISMRSHFMAKLERDTFMCAGNLLNLSTNPFQLCHPHLVVNGKAPFFQQEAIIMPNLKNKKAVIL